MWSQCCYIAQIIKCEIVLVIGHTVTQVVRINLGLAKGGCKNKFRRTIYPQSGWINAHRGEVATQCTKGISHTSGPCGSLHLIPGVPQCICQILCMDKKRYH